MAAASVKEAPASSRCVGRRGQVEAVQRRTAGTLATRVIGRPLGREGKHAAEPRPSSAGAGPPGFGRGQGVGRDI